ncbi:MAG TPA: MerR family transcriptional regulator [Polyangiaceae bacterium]|nr:MerR family transcriptional regulator [Polyangiaceae bacterium]
MPAQTDRRHLRIAYSNDVRGAQPIDDADLLQVGDLASATGKTVRAIHLYEDLGLLEPARRSKGHYRLFSPDAAMRVRWISKLQSLGLSLSEIQELVQKRVTSESAMRAATELKEVYESKLREVKTKLKELKELETELQASLAYLDQCNVACESDVAVHSCVSCVRHTEAPTKPELVAGAEIE